MRDQIFIARQPGENDFLRATLEAFDRQAPFLYGETQRVEIRPDGYVIGVVDALDGMSPEEREAERRSAIDDAQDD